MFIKLLLLSLPLLAFAFLGFAVTIILKKNGEFPETRVGHNKTMRKRKIFCYNTQQRIIDKNIKKSNQKNNLTCGAC
ncbi:MAG: hypothetical protein JXR51_15085 [Bacteroidales bacterium]|nr:hypothetical protein [Bacteroidales bacterium]MBN2758496.1 hypothetical protein [Bacteroidales bacterium]